MSEATRDEDAEVLALLANNPLVREARWGDAILHEIKTSPVIEEIKANVEEAERTFYEQLLDAQSDEERREIQLLARAYRVVRDLFADLEKKADEAVEKLRNTQDVDAAADDFPD